jgi:hypothetical protein
MQTDPLEFFKLDPIDRKVLFWLIDNVPVKSLKSWLEYIAREYKDKGIQVDPLRLYDEVQKKES